MKKIIVFLTLLIMIFALVGCTSDKTSGTEKSTSSSANKTDSNSSNTQSDTSKKENINSQTSENGLLVGKVDKIIGNEISIKLLADDFELTDDMKKALGIVELSEDDINRLNAGETIELPDGGKMGAATPGTGDPNEGAVLQDEFEKNSLNQQMREQEQAALEDAFSRMEFSGEGKDFTIKAGTPIVNYLSGKEASLSDIRKGSLVTIELDNKGTVVNIVINVN